MENPFPETMVDEDSGVETTDWRHLTWELGRQAGRTEVIELIGRAAILAEHPHFFDEEVR